MTGGLQSGRYDAGPDLDTGRSVARWVLAFALLWLGGIGSLVALPLAGLALASGDVGGRMRRITVAALVLGALGLASSVALFVSA